MKKILIVDDTPTNIDLLVGYLEEDYELLIALDGLQALNILEHEIPDLILLDIRMPNLDGFETCLRIKKDERLLKVPIVFLTAESNEESIKKAFESGGVDFISKPIILAELSARITTHLKLADYSHNLENIIENQTKTIKEKSQKLIDTLYLDNNSNLKNTLSLQRDLLDYKSGTIYLIDIDNFNVVNKLYGFTFGDRVLKEIGLKIDSLFNDETSLYKLGSDRYALVNSYIDELEIEQICNTLFEYFDKNKILVDEIPLKVTLSIGVAPISKDRDTIIEAEYAIDISKKLGKRYSFLYTKDSNFIKNEKDNIFWLNKTRDFIEKDMIVPFFQPIVDISTNKVYKYEALARVIENGEIIPPYKFLLSAKKLGLLSSITKSMITKCFKKFQNSDIKFSINITERDLLEDYLNDFIVESCEKYSIKPENFTLELLENITLSSDNEYILTNLGKIKSFGCKIAIDDFGSENSNFSRIISLKSDYLKIDGMFIRDIDKDEEKQKVISAIVQLAKKLEIKTVAEFVFDEAIFKMVKDLGVDYAQGYFLGKPQELEL